jgi:hypothetical protein
MSKNLVTKLLSSVRLWYALGHGVWIVDRTRASRINECLRAVPLARSEAWPRASGALGNAPTEKHNQSPDPISAILRLLNTMDSFSGVLVGCYRFWMNLGQELVRVVEVVVIEFLEATHRGIPDDLCGNALVLTASIEEV